jgi:excisionase family DNA binding protein
MSAEPTPLTMSRPQAAKRLGISEKAVRDLVRSKRLRFVLIKARMRFTENDLIRFLEEGSTLWVSDAVKARRTTGAIFRSTVLDFDAACRQITFKKRS